MLTEKRLCTLLRIVTVFAISFCCLFLFPAMRNFIIETGEKMLGPVQINHDLWMDRILFFLLVAIFCFISILLSTTKNIQTFLDSNISKVENIYILASIIIIILSIIVRLIMYTKSRSLWIDEARLAESIVTRNLSELLMPPLANNQSAPVLYVIFVKLIAVIFGYSEFSLRVFSLLSFLGLLLFESLLMKSAFGYSNFRISFVVAMTALLPVYIWYSNEFKPYMSDAFFAVLIILLYYYYTQNKIYNPDSEHPGIKPPPRINLPLLTVSYILILGFSSPSIFFIAGTLVFEFLDAAFNKRKKHIISVIISGAVILVVFGLYYHWWMSPIQEFMKAFWNDYDNQFNTNMLSRIMFIFSPRVGYSNSLFLIFFVPIALFGFFSLCRSANKIAYSVVLSLFFALMASAIGYWPMTGRLWLFLPVIILIFTPAGIDFINDKFKHTKILKTMEFLFIMAINLSLSINSLGYIGSKAYFPKHELNHLISYTQENIKEDEKLYVYSESKYTFDFKNGYTATKIGNVVGDNIISAIETIEWNESLYGNVIASILGHRKVYLLSTLNDDIDKDLEILRNFGTITEVMNTYDTPLYYFEGNTGQ